MQSKAATVDQYLAELPDDRRQAIQAVRNVILKNIDRGFQEGMQYGMIGYFVPHSLYPAGYHCDPKQPLPFACLASQKNYMSLYLMFAYASPAEEKWLRDQWAAAGKKLDMGKCCIRFRKLEDLPLDALGRVFRRVSVNDHISHYESTLLKINRRTGARTAKPKPTVREDTAAAPRRNRTARRAGKKR